MYELLVGSESIKKMIINRANVHEIRELAIKEGMSTLLKEGMCVRWFRSIEVKPLLVYNMYRCVHYLAIKTCSPFVR